MERARCVYNAFQLKLWEVRKELRVLGFNFGMEFSTSNAAKGRLPVTPEEFQRIGLSDDQQGCALLLQSEEAAWCYRTKMQHLLDAGQVIAITRLLQLQVVSTTRHYDSMFNLQQDLTVETAAVEWHGRGRLNSSREHSQGYEASSLKALRKGKHETDELLLSR